MKILLTGATGFIGKNLVKALGIEHEVVILTRATTNQSLVKDNQVIISDRDPKQLEKRITAHRFDGVIHLASFYINQHRLEDIEPLVQSNIVFGTHVLELAQKNHVKWFINTGTLFQHFENKLYNPVNLYAATKQAFEIIAKYYYESSDLNFVTLKLNDTYGPGDTRRKIFNLWKKCAESGKELKMSSGNQIMDMLYIDDVVDGFLMLVKLISEDQVKSLCGSSFCLPSKQRVSLKELASIFEKVTGTKLNIDWGYIDYRPREVMEPASIVEALPGWEQKISFEAGISKLMADR